MGGLLFLNSHYTPLLCFFSFEPASLLASCNCLSSTALFLAGSIFWARGTNRDRGGSILEQAATDICLASSVSLALNWHTSLAPSGWRVWGCQNLSRSRPHCFPWSLPLSSGLCSPRGQASGPGVCWCPGSIVSSRHRSWQLSLPHHCWVASSWQTPSSPTYEIHRQSLPTCGWVWSITPYTCSSCTWSFIYGSVETHA